MPILLIREFTLPEAVLLLRGLDKRLTDKININFNVVEDPLHAVARGTGVALKNVEKFKFLMR